VKHLSRIEPTRQWKAGLPRSAQPSSLVPRPPGACTKTVDRKEYAGCYYSTCVGLVLLVAMPPVVGLMGRFSTLVELPAKDLWRWLTTHLVGDRSPVAYP